MCCGMTSAVVLLQGYPYSPHGDNNSPPNMADQVNPPQANYFKRDISVGCSPSEAYPFAFQPHYVQHVDPTTGNVTKLIVVPAAMVGHWALCRMWWRAGSGAVTPYNDVIAFAFYHLQFTVGHFGDNSEMDCIQSINQSINLSITSSPPYPPISTPTAPSHLHFTNIPSPTGPSHPPTASSHPPTAPYHPSLDPPIPPLHPPISPLHPSIPHCTLPTPPYSRP